MRSDCGDIRFTDSDKFSTLFYFLESGCNTPETVFWVNVPIIVPGKRIYAYYGLSAAESESSGEHTFIFFDGFNGTFLDPYKWHPSACVSVYGGYAHMYSLGDYCSLKLAGDLPNAGVIHLKARRGINESGRGPGYIISYPDNTSAFEIGGDQKEGRWFLYSGKPYPTSIYGGAIDLDDHILRVAYDVSGRIYYFYADSSQIAKNRAYSPGALASLNLLSGGISKEQDISDSYYDYFFIRKYTDTEPEADPRDEETLTPASTLAATASDDTMSSKPALTTSFISTTGAVATTPFSTSPSFTATTAAQAIPVNSSHPLDEVGREKKSSDSRVEQKSMSIWSFFTPLLFILPVFLLLYLFVQYRRRKAESSKESKKVLRWIANELLSGEDPEVVKKAVRDSGMDPSIVDKAKKTLK
jgi:hypothetical protein